MERQLKSTRLDSMTISVAAAHGITPRVAASWYPWLIRSPRVLVPIELDVLMVRDPNRSWADCQMRTPPESKPHTDTTPAATLLAAPFTNLTTPRPVGAYLQWYLPRGLTSGVSDAATNTATFPPIPDRWLVLRISTTIATTSKRAATSRDVAGQQGRGVAISMPRRTVTGWVLEAGGEPATFHDLDGWTEPGVKPNVQNPLTALGHGDLSWAGYYDNTINRLSFYDASLNDVTGPISYVVCGWYADAAADPLGAQSVTSLDGFDATMKAMGWALQAGELKEVVRKRRDYISAARMMGLATAVSPEVRAMSGAAPDAPASAEFTTDGSWWPTATLFHGAVVDIKWPQAGDTHEAGGPPDASTISVGVGNTMAETMGALIASANNDPNQAAIVEAIQMNALAELDQPDGRAQLDVKLHTASFASMAGGPPTTEPFKVAPSGPVQAPPAKQPMPGHGVFANQLSDTGGGHMAPISKSGKAVHAQHAGQLSVTSGLSPIVQAEETIISGRIHDVLGALNGGPQAPASDPGGMFDANRAAPRLFTPRDPILLIAGGKRAFAHDSGVYTVDGMVQCRLTPVSELSWMMPQENKRHAVSGRNVLDRGVENGSVPVECEGILDEVALLDHGAADVIASYAASKSAAPSTFDRMTAKRNIAVEQTAWYALRDPRVDHAPLLARSGITGNLPAPFAIAPHSLPWNPVHLDWAVEFFPTPSSELQPTPSAMPTWALDELDFTLDPGAPAPKPGTGLPFAGRAPVTGGAGAALSSAIQRAMEQAARIGGTGSVPANSVEKYFSIQSQALIELYQSLSVGGASGQSQSSGYDNSQLSNISTALDHMDVLSCGLDGLLTQLRGGVRPDGVSTAPGVTLPSPFFGIRGGVMRLTRLRLVDGFGQYVDLCGSDATHGAQNYLVSPPLTVPGQTGLVGLPPRFTAPTRAWFRWMAADSPETEADYQTSPVCAYLMPNHLDGSLEFFNGNGSGAGSLIPLDDGRVIWQDAPGNVTSAGHDPSPSLTNTHAVLFAQGLIDWGLADADQTREPALSALLRTIDSTRWTVDPYGHIGDEHLALLVGHPVCVMRALLRLDVIDPVDTLESRVTAIPIRLGSLTHWQDGLLGYFVNDDYTTLHVADAAAAGMARPLGPKQGFLQPITLVPQYYSDFANDLATLAPGATLGGAPVTHPYVDTSGVLWIRPNQTINLTLLVEPLTTVHATAGLVPRKEIGVRREWVQAGLAAIAPTFSFGPVLVDPKHIRMPLATDLNGTWVWDYRSDASAWTENPVTNATDNALLAQDPPTGVEGWLKLEPPSSKGSGS